MLARRAALHVLRRGREAAVHTQAPAGPPPRLCWASCGEELAAAPIQLDRESCSFQESEAFSAEMPKVIQGFCLKWRYFCRRQLVPRRPHQKYYSAASGTTTYRCPNNDACLATDLAFFSFSPLFYISFLIAHFHRASGLYKIFPFFVLLQHPDSIF